MRFGREIELTVDGKTSTHWVTATDVDGALSQIGVLYRGADLSTSRGTTIDRGGLELEVVTPKTLKVTLAGKKTKKVSVPALTVDDALRALDVKLDKHDLVFPKRGAKVDDGDKVRWVDIEIKTKRVKGESFSAATITREDSSSPEGTETVVRSGESGMRNVVYKIRYRNGVEVKRSDRHGQGDSTSPSPRSSRSAPRRSSPPTTPAAAPSGTPWRSASPAATGPSTPATATTAACSSTSAPGRRTAARATRTRTAVRRRSPSPSGSVRRPVATAPGRAARPASACRCDPDR